MIVRRKVGENWENTTALKINKDKNEFNWQSEYGDPEQAAGAVAAIEWQKIGTPLRLHPGAHETSIFER